ncbi:MAG: nuclear transport factor 2 family protein [Candidatus Thermoplasmatota archaeon]
MDQKGEVRTFLERWAKTTQARDAEHAADLYLRVPPALVTFSDGERSEDWLDIRVRLERDFARSFIEHVEPHDIQITEPSDDVLLLSYAYDLHVRDMWGTPKVATKHATMALVRTKDGLRIASAHFSST